MKRVTKAAFALGTLAALGAAPAAADHYGEIEAARMNAKAGGPTNARDAELLRRWGCYSDTQTPYCQSLRQRDLAATAPKRRRTQY